jgi:hypothetical protein
MTYEELWAENDRLEKAMGTSATPAAFYDTFRQYMALPPVYCHCEHLYSDANPRTKCPHCGYGCCTSCINSGALCICCHKRRLAL